MNTENKNTNESGTAEKKLVTELLTRIAELSERLEKIERKLNKPLIS